VARHAGWVVTVEERPLPGERGQSDAGVRLVALSGLDVQNTAATGAVVALYRWN
jgi:hypothetical protein